MYSPASSISSSPLHLPSPHLHHSAFSQSTKVLFHIHFHEKIFRRMSLAHTFYQSLDSEFHFGSNQSDEEISEYSVYYMHVFQNASGMSPTFYKHLMCLVSPQIHIVAFKTLILQAGNSFFCSLECVVFLNQSFVHAASSR